MTQIIIEQYGKDNKFTSIEVDGKVLKANTTKNEILRIVKGILG